MVKNLPANAGDAGEAGLIPGLGRSPGEGHGKSLQYSCLENLIDREAWWATVHKVPKSRTWLKQLCRHAHTRLRGWACSRFIRGSWIPSDKNRKAQTLNHDPLMFFKFHQLKSALPSARGLEVFYKMCFELPLCLEFFLWDSTESGLVCWEVGVFTPVLLVCFKLSRA